MTYMKFFGQIKNISFKSGAKAANAMVALEMKNGTETVLVFRGAAQIQRLKSFTKGDKIWAHGTPKSFSNATRFLDVLSYKKLEI